jgi:CHAT domain-containing protein
VADGLLHLVPFSALPSPDNPTRYVVEQHEVIYLPSASVIAALRSRRAPAAPVGSLAVIADPAFGDQFRRLDFSRIEAERILGLAAPGRRLAATGAEATKELLQQGRVNGYATLHLATHAIVDTRQPEWSRIVLSEVDGRGRARDGSLRLWEIYGLKLDADMVVLSACRTALGRQVRGEGLIGLTRGFFYAGARRVVASLWDVQDRATAELMSRFYSEFLHHRLEPAAALRRAQLGLLGDPRWRAPYYWAPFVIQGDWDRR